MRLSDDIQFLKGVGPKRAEQFRSAGLNTVQDLLDITPRKYISHEHGIPIRDIQEKQHVTVIGRVLSFGIYRGRKQRFVLSISDGSGILKGVWFRYISSQQNRFEEGMLVAISGIVAYFSGFQIIHPQVEILSETSTEEKAQFILPIYSIPETLRNARLSSESLRKFVQKILDEITILPSDELLPKKILHQQGFPPLLESYQKVHFPESQDSAEKAIRRFKFTELFLLQLYLLLRKEKQKSLNNGIAFPKLGNFFEEILKNLPFELTEPQKKVLREIRSDMKLPIPMNRMIQGDVGSGKTIVAILAMSIAAGNGYQSAFMAPTEILAEQHYLNLIQFTRNTSLRIVLLTGRLKEGEKKERLALIANGMCDIVVGTHAIIQKSVHFQNLAFLVIDEQHRFGVAQRFALADKGSYPDTLLMTATPIPRSMALSVYGDLDMSIIDQAPSGRKAIKTGWRYTAESNKIETFVKSRLAEKEQVYIVFPLVEESEKLDLQAAVSSFDELEKAYPNSKLALLHGKMKSIDKEKVMENFKAGKIDILVSTTVIEVGVDVPNATLMIIEHADRFGLSQLHQLRGRVGRSEKQSYCILKSDFSISDESKARLNIICQSTDGFEIAEEDLNLRGIGDLFGTKQSGFSDSKMLSLLGDYKLLESARKSAETFLASDPQLRKMEHQKLRQVVISDLAKKYGLLHIA